MCVCVCLQLRPVRTGTCKPMTCVEHLGKKAVCVSGPDDSFVVVVVVVDAVE